MHAISSILSRNVQAETKSKTMSRVFSFKYYTYRMIHQKHNPRESSNKSLTIRLKIEKNYLLRICNSYNFKRYKKYNVEKFFRVKTIIRNVKLLISIII